MPYELRDVGARTMFENRVEALFNPSGAITIIAYDDGRHALRQVVGHQRAIG